MTGSLPAPHGGRLVDLVVGPDRAGELTRRAANWPSWTLTRRQSCDLELLACGGFSPLTGFLGRSDYLAVCESMRLADGRLWPIPITLDVPDEVAGAATDALALRDPQGALLAVLHVEDTWRPDREREAALVFGRCDPTHPGVAHLLRATQRNYVSGRLEVLRLPAHAAFTDLRRTPDRLRTEFARRGWNRVVAFQTRNPMHRAHQQLTLRAAERIGAKLLINPIVGAGKPGDVDPYTRVRCYRALLPTYPTGTALLSVLPLAMRMAGPREALWHALIRQNFGASHFIVGRDHAGPGPDANGQAFYAPYAGHELLAGLADEIGIEILPFKRMAYLPDFDTYLPEDEVPDRTRTLSISGTELRARLARGDELPEWFTPPEVARELRRAYPPRTEQGFTVFLTGLSGAGKSTIGAALEARLREAYGRYSTLLDGDLVRRHLSAGAGFGRADRDAHVRRIGFVAAEVTRHGGVAICPVIAPFDAARREVRRMVEPAGGFVLVHVATPVQVCERRDVKGLYARARAGSLPKFTGVDDPYEVPTDADLVVETCAESAEQAAQRILDRLAELGYLAAGAAGEDSRTAGRRTVFAPTVLAAGTA